MANCDAKCPVFRQIETLRDKCLACNVCGRGNTLQVGGSGVVHLDAAEEPETILQRSVGKRKHLFEEEALEAELPHNVTQLPEDVEETLRFVLTSLFGLTPIEFLLLHHLDNGGNLGNFSAYIADLMQDLGKYKRLNKGTAWAIFQRIGSAFGPFRALAGGLIGKGKGGAVKQALKKSLL